MPQGCSSSYNVAKEEWDRFAKNCLPRQIRGILEFAEAEIVMPPGGPNAGERFRARKQPFAAMFLREIEKAERGEVPWTDFMWTGCTQSGKTTLALIVLMYFLFELEENVIFGIPTIKLSGKKFTRDIKPIIMASRYAKLMPIRGAGAKGGTNLSAVYFRNGTSLTFMAAGGGREERSGDTTRCLIVTEADSFSEQDEQGGEGRKIDQLIARTHSHGHRRRVFTECTVTTEENYIWDTYKHKSSESVIVSQCPSCAVWIRPEREHFVGWQEAQSQIEAGKCARWMCPACGILLSEEQRQEMVSGSRLIHKGQVIGSDGAVSGPIPDTRTLGFRWNAWDNRLAWTTAFIGETEYNASKAEDSESAGITMDQFHWCKPRKSSESAAIKLDSGLVRKKKLEKLTRGLVPADTQLLVLGSDVGKRLCYWTLMAQRANGSLHVVDYGCEITPDDKLPPERSIPLMLAALRDKVEDGWPIQGEPGMFVPDVVGFDSGYEQDVVFACVREFGSRYRSVRGQGFAQGQKGEDTSYHEPKKTNANLRAVGEGFYVEWLPEKMVEQNYLSADYFKTKLHESIIIPHDQPGAFTMFSASEADHHSFSNHLTAEQMKELTEFRDGQWIVRRVWRKVKTANHWLDSTSYSVMLLSLAKLLNSVEQTSSVVVSDKFHDDDGRPLLVAARV